MSGTRDFNRALLGYDRRQVNAFCDEVDDIVGELRGRADDLEQMQRAKPITAEQAFANVARETWRILQAAQEAGARMLKESREQARSELALARRKRSQIIGDGYRARDEMTEQLRQLDRARARLISQLQDATAEIDRLAAGLEEGGRRGANEASLAARRAERALTGTDEGRRPLPSSAPLRVIAGADARPSRVHVARREPADLSRRGTGDGVVADRRDLLGPLRIVLIERLNDELGAVRDRLHERLRRAGDVGGATVAFTVDDAGVAGIAEATTRSMMAPRRRSSCARPSTSERVLPRRSATVCSRRREARTSTPPWARCSTSGSVRPSVNCWPRATASTPAVGVPRADRRHRVRTFRRYGGTDRRDRTVARVRARQAGDVVER
ncbi:MAG TPA: DivIVA domain-containing protein [Euzebyales bacterium]|nr:DivIVA domain-containing protein [Euzebyales bacterium]